MPSAKLPGVEGAFVAVILPPRPSAADVGADEKLCHVCVAPTDGEGGMVAFFAAKQG